MFKLFKVGSVWQMYLCCPLVDREEPWFVRCTSEPPDLQLNLLLTSRRTAPVRHRKKRTTTLSYFYIWLYYNSFSIQHFWQVPTTYFIFSISLWFFGLVSWCIPEQKNKQKTRCDVELTASLHRKTSRVSVASCSSSFISRTNWRSWTPRAAHQSLSCVLFNQLHLKLYQSNQSENTQHKYYYNYSVFYRKEERDSHFMAVVIGSWKWWFWRRR